MPRKDPLPATLARVIQAVTAWPGVTTAPHRFGGVQFQLGRGEIGHVHERGLLDVAFPKPVRDELVRTGQARPHHRLPSSGWVSFPIDSDADVPHAIALLRMAYDARRAGREPEESSPAQASEDALDEAIEESFPASDPPAVGHEE